MRTPCKKEVMIYRIYVLVFLLVYEVTFAKTVRYKQGAMDGESLEERQKISVPDAREVCRQNPSCVSFSFASPTRFPNGHVTCYFFPFSDWHFKLSGEPSFVEDSNWHSYMNTTRERDVFPHEISLILKQIQQEKDKNPTSRFKGTEGKRLRQSGAVANKERTSMLFFSLYTICWPEEFRGLAAPLVASLAIQSATSKEEDEVVRLTALNILVLASDSTETGKLLFDAGLYPAVKQIIEEREKGAKEWSELSERALDVLSNLCLHRSANAELVKAGASKFLGSLLAEPGFPGLQALLALTHLGKPGNAVTELDSLSLEMLSALVSLLSNTIDGETSYGIQWELVPGPLSAINHLILYSYRDNPVVIDKLLNAGVMEHLLRVLDSDCLVASDIEEALQVIFLLAQVSERAKRMVLLAEHQIHETEIRLQKYSRSLQLAIQLNDIASEIDSARYEL